METKTARSWYVWLWWSPAVTVPTVYVFYFSELEQIVRNIVCPDRSCGSILKYAIPIVSLLIVSSLWHLILLIPALNKESVFVRWHGRQALMLAGVRTVVPIVLVLWSGDEIGLIPAIPVLIVIWLFGTLWGQRQAARGDCSLMRWFGHREALPVPEPVEESSQIIEKDTDTLVATFRYSNDPQERRKAFSILEKLGQVEEL